MPRGMLVRLVGLGLLVLGIVAVAVSVADGAAHLALLVVFPVVYGSSALFAGGVLLAFVGFFLTLLGFAAGEGTMAQGVGPGPAEEVPARGTGPSSSTGSRGGFGGVVLLGPVPIVFTNRSGWVPYLVALAVVMVIAWVVWTLLVLRP